MPITSTRAHRIAGITSCVPAKKFDNLADTTDFPKEEVEKVVKMAGVKSRHVADESICSSDLCLAAAKDLMASLSWEPDSVDALIFVTQSPDYFLPSTACLSHRDLGLKHECAAFDVGLGCSGYPYGLWLASMMLQSPRASQFQPARSANTMKASTCPWARAAAKAATRAAPIQLWPPGCRWRFA